VHTLQRRFNDAPCCSHPLAHSVGSLSVVIWLVYLALIQTGQACARQRWGQVAENGRLGVLDIDRVAERRSDERLPHHAAPSACDAQASGMG
jgi:hypothetical protein